MAMVSASAVPLLTDELLARFRRGDEAAFMNVYDAHAADLRPLVWHYFRTSPFEREEATQEVWLHVHRMAASFDPARGALLPWLRTLAANRCREILRAAGRRPVATLEVDDKHLPAAETPESAVRQERRRAAVNAFCATLTGDEAAVFRLSFVEELSHGEVATKAGISPRRAKYLKLKLLARAAEAPALRAALADLEEP
jgi:RNA polymerase sigma-70 factor, ECF subfamily